MVMALSLGIESQKEGVERYISMKADQGVSKDSAKTFVRFTWKKKWCWRFLNGVERRIQTNGTARLLLYGKPSRTTSRGLQRMTRTARRASRESEKVGRATVFRPRRSAPK